MTKHGCSDRVVNLQGAAEHRNPSAHTSTADLELAKSLAPLANRSHSNQAQAAPASLAEIAVQWLATPLECKADGWTTVGSLLLRQVIAQERYAAAAERIADHIDPCGGDRLVGTRYVATRIGRTPRRVCDMARDGIITPDCIADWGGDGGHWKFYPKKIDSWIEKHTSKHPR